MNLKNAFEPQMNTDLHGCPACSICDSPCQSGEARFYAHFGFIRVCQCPSVANKGFIV